MSTKVRITGQYQLEKVDRSGSNPQFLDVLKTDGNGNLFLGTDVGVSINGMLFPESQGTNLQALATDGAGNLFFNDYVDLVSNQSIDGTKTFLQHTYFDSDITVNGTITAIDRDDLYVNDVYVNLNVASGTEDPANDPAESGLIVKRTSGDAGVLWVGGTTNHWELKFGNGARSRILSELDYDDFVNVTGDTMTGDLLFSQAASPIVGRTSASAPRIDLGANTANGDLTLASGNSTSAGHVKIRPRGVSSSTNESFFNASGVVTMPQPQTSRAPTTGNDLTNKTYVDDVAGDLGTNKVSRSGDNMTGNLRLDDSVVLAIGTGNDVEHFWDGSNYYTDVNGGANWVLRDGNSSNATRFTFDIDTGNLTATTFTGALSGNASTASRWLNSRTLSLSGDASGSVSWNGSANASMSVSVSNSDNADKWLTARTLTLGGDLTGSVAFDGSSNFTLSAQVVNDSHTHDTRYLRLTGGTVTGTITAPAFNTNSAMKYKTDVSYDIEGAMDMIMGIDVIRYVGKNDPDKKVCLGVSAETVAEHAPEYVNFINGEADSVNYGQMTALLIKVLQDNEKKTMRYKFKKLKERVSQFFTNFKR